MRTAKLLDRTATLLERAPGLLSNPGLTTVLEALGGEPQAQAALEALQACTGATDLATWTQHAGLGATLVLLRKAAYP
jgi:hypothetical protein